MSSIGRQLSFAAGEVSPAIAARPDLVKFHSGLATLRNFIVLSSGGVESRPGTSWSGPVKDHTRKVRLYPFVYDKDWRYVLEFGHLYLRFHKDGRVALSSAYTANITGITNANPATVTISIVDLFSTGDEVRIDGVAGMPEINGRHYKVTKLSSTTYSLQDQATGQNIDSTGFGTYSSGGTIGRPIEAATVFEESELEELQFSQHGNVLTITHPKYGIWELIRQSPAVTILRKAVFGTILVSPSNVSATGGPTGTKTFRWKVTAVYKDGFEETLAGKDGSPLLITSITNTNPARVTVTSPHGLSTGDEVYIEGVAGMTEVNGRHFRVIRISSTQVDLEGEDATEHGTYFSGGSLYKTWAERANIDTPTSASPVTVTASPVDGAIEYNVYREKDGIYGWIGSTSKVNPSSGLVEFNDIGYTQDMLDSPPIPRYPFVGVGKKPGAVGSFQRRRYFGGSDNSPEGIQASRVGFISNFFVYTTINDDDPIAAVLVGKKLGRIRHFLDAGKLLVFTDTGEWIIDGDSNGVLSPGAFNARLYTEYGSDRIAPILVGGLPVFVTRGRAGLREISFTLERDGIVSGDLTVFSRHLLDGYRIETIAYAQTPGSILWIVRNDGKLLGLTILREQELLGWHRHDTDGLFESAAVMEEVDSSGLKEDRLYVVVSRTIAGQTRRYVERMARVSFESDQRKLITLDSSVTYDGTNTGAGTLAITGGTTWSETELLVLSAGSGKTFEASEVGSGYIVSDGTGDSVRFRITQFVDSTTVKGFSHKTVPTTLRNQARTTWTKGTKTVYGLWHLEGKEVAVYGDGFVVANPKNSKFGSPLVVTGGKVTLPDWYGIVTVGLPYVSDLETLNLDSAQSSRYADARKLAAGAILVVQGSGAFFVGGKAPSSDSDVSNLKETRLPSTGQSWDAIPRLDGNVEVGFGGSWTDGGRIWVRRLDPVPVRILAVKVLGATGGG